MTTLPRQRGAASERGAARAVRASDDSEAPNFWGPRPSDSWSDDQVVPLPSTVAAHPDLRWVNARGTRGFVHSWIDLIGLLDRVGEEVGWAWVRVDELTTGAWVRASGRAHSPRHLAIEIGEPHHDSSRLAVLIDTNPWPRHDVGDHGWVLLASEDELLDTINASAIIRTWFWMGVIPQG